MQVLPSTRISTRRLPSHRKYASYLILFMFISGSRNFGRTLRSPNELSFMSIFTTPRFGVGEVPVDRAVQRPLSRSGLWGLLRESQVEVPCAPHAAPAPSSPVSSSRLGPWEPPAIPTSQEEKRSDRFLYQVRSLLGPLRNGSQAQRPMNALEPWVGGGGSLGQPKKS